ncbi:MAG: SPOR domain-containing protein [Rhodospirillales bacterium]|nr:MAG: SPOR domain-containing protein [Rhodospirillales bacterium]
MSDKPNRERLEPELGQDLLDILPDRGIGGMGGDLPPRPLPRKKRRGFLLWFLVIFLASGAAVATWWFVVSGSKPAGIESEVPLVKADQRNFKSKPSAPGGMDVPDQDKMVYDRLSASEEANKPPVERLLPPPEAPQAPPAPQAVAPVVPVAPVTPVAPPSLPDMPQAPAKETPKATPPSLGAATPPEPAPVEPPALAQAPAIAKPAVKKPAKAEDVTVKVGGSSASGGSWLVQLGAITDEAAASREWGRIQKANSDLLGSLGLDVQKADLGAKGIFYRLRAGGLESKEAAQQLCTQLAARKQGCIVVRK